MRCSRWGLLLAIILLALSAVPASAARSCRSNADCGDDDDVFCNGRTVCQLDGPAFLRGHCVFQRVDCNDSIACTVDRCDEPSRECRHEPQDLDGDGHGDGACGGDDCDDGDASRHPGAPEVCDAALDEDCDPSTFGTQDVDGDTFVDADCCNGDNCGTDCDDGTAAIHPGLPDICDGRDQDCDGDVDEDERVDVFGDVDLDGFGAGASSEGCPAAGLSVLGNDCDDTNPAIHPGEMICETPTSLQVCLSDGTWSKGRGCSGGGPCVSQPNETGICLPPANSPPDPI